MTDQLFSELDQAARDALCEYALRLGDDSLALGHRLSEWCGIGPILEEDIALSNISLDLIGQAEAFLQLAGDLESKGRDADKLAYFRDEYEYRCLQLVEQPKGDFAFTMIRQFLYDAFAYHLYEALSQSAFEPLAALAAKTLKETAYHLRHARQWTLRLGDGVEESHRRAQDALDRLWRFTDELFYADEVDRLLLERGFAPDVETLRPKWRGLVAETLAEAKLTAPESVFMASGSRQGRHSEHLGHMLAEMQILARSHPEAKW